jgi:hypothetical protein
MEVAHHYRQDKNPINNYPPRIKKPRNENDTVHIDNTSWIENVGYNLAVFEVYLPALTVTHIIYRRNLE